MMLDQLLTALAVLRIIPLVILMFYSVRYRDKTAMLIALLWAAALVFGSFFHNREVSQIVASPLVVLVVWYIVRRQGKS